jgi:GNS1/SUR4 family
VLEYIRRSLSRITPHGLGPVDKTTMVWSPRYPKQCVRYAVATLHPYEEIQCILSLDSKWSWLAATYQPWEFTLRLQGPSWRTIVWTVVVSGLAMSVGKYLMLLRPPWRAGPFVTLWNLFYMSLSLIGFLRLLPVVVHNYSSFSLQDNVCGHADMLWTSGTSGLWATLWVYLKLLEVLVETVLVVILQQPCGLAQWFHHYAYVLIHGNHLLTSPIPGGSLVIMTNFGIASIMNMVCFFQNLNPQTKQNSTKLFTFLYLLQIFSGVVLSITTLQFWKLYMRNHRHCHAKEEHVRIAAFAWTGANVLIAALQAINQQWALTNAAADAARRQHRHRLKDTKRPTQSVKFDSSTMTAVKKKKRLRAAPGTVLLRQHLKHRKKTIATTTSTFYSAIATIPEEPAKEEEDAAEGENPLQQVQDRAREPQSAKQDDNVAAEEENPAKRDMNLILVDTQTDELSTARTIAVQELETVEATEMREATESAEATDAESTAPLVFPDTEKHVVTNPADIIIIENGSMDHSGKSSLDSSSPISTARAKADASDAHDSTNCDAMDHSGKSSKADSSYANGSSNSSCSVNTITSNGIEGVGGQHKKQKKKKKKKKKRPTSGSISLEQQQGDRNSAATNNSSSTLDPNLDDQHQQGNNQLDGNWKVSPARKKKIKRQQKQQKQFQEQQKREHCQHLKDEHQNTTTRDQPFWDQETFF